MVKHTQTIRRRQQLANFLRVFDHFVELALKGLNNIFRIGWKQLHSQSGIFDDPPDDTQ